MPWATQSKMQTEPLRVFSVQESGWRAQGAVPAAERGPAKRPHKAEAAGWHGTAVGATEQRDLSALGSGGSAPSLPRLPTRTRPGENYGPTP